MSSPDHSVSELRFADFPVGRRFTSGTQSLSAAEIKEFAGQFDPQPFHLDEVAAETTFFRGLAASGWHTAAVTMRLLIGSGMPIKGGMIGAGCELSWPRPTRPGDTLQVETEVIATRSLDSRPEFGMVTLKSETRNQRGELVQTMIAKIMVPI